jgi:signal transduction histidine kinase/ActR/RegA family two-component response regulator
LTPVAGAVRLIPQIQSRLGRSRSVLGDAIHKGGDVIFHRELRPGRDVAITFCAFVLAAVALAARPEHDFFVLHTILDTSACLISAGVALLLWDLAWRTSGQLVRFVAVAFAIATLAESLHFLSALQISATLGEPRRWTLLLWSATWTPAAYLLPLSLGAVLWSRRKQFESRRWFALGLFVSCLGLFTVFQQFPLYGQPGWVGITRPTLTLVPLLWMFIGLAYWRLRSDDRLARVLACYAVIAIPANLIMLYSQSPADAPAIIAHVGKLLGGLFLFFSLTEMGMQDTSRRMRAERDLKQDNETLDGKVLERTQALEAANATLRVEMATREVAETKGVVQLKRLDLLQNITRAVGERQDLTSIFQVVVRNLEKHMPVDFACLCNYQPHDQALIVASVGPDSGALAPQLGLSEGTRLEISENDLLGSVRGELVYTPDALLLQFPLPQRLAQLSLRSLVAAPLLVERGSGILGVLLVARFAPDAFNSGDCEFLRQLSEHVALATNHAQLYGALQQAYDELHLTQQAVLQQERLRALGHMASGIAHDINNAISPISLYSEALLAHEHGLSVRGRNQLEVIQRAIGDVAETVGRMSEFYRQGKSPLTLSAMDANRVLGQVLDITRARWRDMAQQCGIVIDACVEQAPGSPLVMGVESEIREALVNLVFNATDAMPQGGKLSLRASVRNGNEAGAQTILEVSDTGVGMDEETRRRCLEPFFTTKGERGSGLGLAMVYGIAQRHGAEIEVVSAVGKGTTIRLIFPVVPSQTRADAPAALAAMPSSRLRILLVDDDPLLLSSLRDVLESDGHYVMTANGGQAGIDAFLAASKGVEPYSVVITDLGMPHVDGRQVSAAVKACSPLTTVLMLTGWGQRMLASDELPPHVDKLLSKPPNMRELRGALSARATGTPLAHS